MECIVLAGGLGTRLRGVIGAAPKCMAMVAGKPFLFHLLDYLLSQGVTRVILSLGYKHELVTQHPDLNTFPLELDFVVEDEPLGTGGGIRLAMTRARTRNVFVANGDTLFRADLQALYQAHVSTAASVTLALKSMREFDRYGTVEIDSDRKITAFREKRYCAEGLINGGVYLIDKSAFLAQTGEGAFSFETDYLQPHVSDGTLYGCSCEQYFIDIGIPSDYEKAQLDFATGFSNEG